jgi:phosphoserine aminotransferase
MAFPARILTNFAAGPSCLPEEVLLKAQEGLLNYDNCGRSVMELSHRGKEFTKIFANTKAALKSVLDIPDNYKILFLQGGGAGQFAALPLNFCTSSTGVADYVVTGSWSKQAAQEAAPYCKVNIAASSEGSKFTNIPPQSEWKLSPDAAYLHYCDNETIHGVIFPEIPTGIQAPLICDMSSSFLSRPIDVSRFGVIYAGAQKNAGIAGVTIAIVREDLLDRTRQDVPSVINYKKKAEADSLDNTPPVFAIYMTLLVLQWIQSKGGLVELEKINRAKAAKVYGVIEKSHGFYTNPIYPAFRSYVNIPIRIKNDATIENEFLAEADKKGLVELKGHRSVGGLRVSLYNALPPAGVDILATFMDEFQRNHSSQP